MANDKKKVLSDQVREQPMTYEEYSALPDDGNRYELVDGYLELMSPSATTSHQFISTLLTAKKHALVVGGSGMLAKTLLWLADNGYLVSLIGRNIQKLNKLSAANKNIIPISVDYYNEKLLKSTINNSITINGSYDLVVAWIHRNEKQIIDIISSEIRRITFKEWRLFHTLGSSSDLIENNNSRWLTHDEISNGVINCISTNSDQYLVGTLTPWNKRP